MTMAAARHLARKSEHPGLLAKTQSGQHEDSQQNYRHHLHEDRAFRGLHGFSDASDVHRDDYSKLFYFYCTHGPVGHRSWYRGPLIFVQILVRNIVLRNFVGVHFLRIFIVRFLYTSHSAGLKDVSFIDQFIDAFRIRLLNPGQAF